MDSTLVWLDYVIIACTLLISSGIGLYYRFTGGRQRTTEEFFIADRGMGVTTIAIGLMVSLLSAASLLGVSSEIYMHGAQYLVIVLGYVLATPVIVHFYLPVFFKLGATSAFEYLELRFGMKTRLVASTVFLVQFLLYTGVVLYAPALAIEATTGLSTTMSILIIGIVCTFYSTIGGIKAVLITDLFQAALMIGSIVIVIVTAIFDVGGIEQVWDIAKEGNRLDFTSTTLDPTVRHTWWSLVIGGFFTYLSLYGVNQIQVQRMLTIRNLKKAKLAVWLSLPITIILIVGICFSGIVLYSKYYECDPKLAGHIASEDQLMPYYIMENLSKYPGIPGLFIAGIFSASLSTVSAVQNSVSAIILEDYIRPMYEFRHRIITEEKSIYVSKFLAFSVGLVCLVVAILVQYLGQNLLQAVLTIFGVVGGPLLGVYTLGMFFESAEQSGAIFGMAGSLFFSLWIGFGAVRTAIPKLTITTNGCDSMIPEMYDILDQAYDTDQDNTNFAGAFSSRLVSPMRNIPERKTPDHFKPGRVAMPEMLTITDLVGAPDIEEALSNLPDLTHVFRRIYNNGRTVEKTTVPGVEQTTLPNVLSVTEQTVMSHQGTVSDTTTLSQLYSVRDVTASPDLAFLPRLIGIPDQIRFLNDTEDNRFYLYRISYLWYCALGFIVCIVIGLLISTVINFLAKKKDKCKDEEPLDPDLFTPFIANRIRKRRQV